MMSVKEGWPKLLSGPFQVHFRSLSDAFQVLFSQVLVKVPSGPFQAGGRKRPEKDPHLKRTRKDLKRARKGHEKQPKPTRKGPE